MVIIFGPGQYMTMTMLKNLRENARWLQQ